MSIYKDTFAEYLKEKDFRYSVRDDDSLDFFIRGKNGEHRILICFDPDSPDTVDFYNLSFGKAPEDRLDQIVAVCNQLNKENRWVKFYVDDDKDIIMEGSLLLELDRVGSQCLPFIKMMIHISDKVYSILMKAIWQ